MTRARPLVRLLFQPLVVAVVLALVARAFIHIYTIPSESMAPTLWPGDHIMVTPYLRGIPDRGDVVVFRSPRNEELLVKRVIALPGDLVHSRMGDVFIGSHALSESYLNQHADSGEIQPQIVPAGSFFVMGDNRLNSLDSRSWGVLPASLIVGRVRLVLWSSADTSSKPVASADSETAQGLENRPTGLRLFHPIE